MSGSNSQARAKEDRALLSMANWVDAPPAESAAPPLAPAPSRTSPLLQGLAANARPVATEPGETLFDLLKKSSRKRQPAVMPARADPPAAPPPPRPAAIPSTTRAAVIGAQRQPKIQQPPPRRAAWAAVPALAAAGAVAGYLTAGAPLHSAKAELILKPEIVRSTNGQPPAGAEQPAVSAAAVQQAMARIGTEAVLGPVADRLSLTAHRDFGAGSRDAAIAALARQVSAAAQTLTPGFTVTATAPGAALSGDIANAVADSLIETHDANAGAPPPTRLEIAFRAMPGVTGPAQSALIPAGIGGLAGALLGAVLAFLWGRRGGATPSLLPRPSFLRPSGDQPPPRKTAKAAPAPKPGPAAAVAARRQPRHAEPPRVSLPRRQPAGVPPHPAVPARPAAVAPPMPRAAAPRSRPAPTEPDPAMYPYPQQAYAPHAQPLAPAPGGWWPQPAGYPQQAMPPMAYPQPHPMAPVQPMAPAGMVHGMMPAGYAQPMPYAPPAMYPAPVAPMAMPHFAPYQPPMQPPVHVQSYAVPYPVPVMMPYPAHVPVQAGTVIQHEAPRAVAPETREPAAHPVAGGPAPEATAEAVSALDEVRAQLRAFAGSLDALRNARSA